jgi:hypothetical protein
MKQVNEAIAHVAAHGGVANLQGWYYDLVRDRLERLGCFRIAGITGGSFEGSTYLHPKGGEFRVVTDRFKGPMTIIKFTPSPKKPVPKG